VFVRLQKINLKEQLFLVGVRSSLEKHLEGSF